MVIGRALLGPIIVIGASHGWSGRWLGAIVLAALLDDIFDGVLARRWKCDTPAIRSADSAADTIFYLGVAWALWIREPQTIQANWKLLVCLAILESCRHVFDLKKFGRMASYHSYLAKLWGLVMAIAVIGVLCFGGLSWLIKAAIALGIAADFEGLTMSVMLSNWQNDVKTLAAARRLQRASRNVN